MSFWFWWLACGVSSTPPQGSDPDAPGHGAGDGQNAVPVVDGVAPVPLTATMSFLGGGAVVPRALTIHLDRSTYTGSEFGTSPTDLRLVTSPEVDGTLTVTDDDDLEWAPSALLRPGTVYTASLTRVDPTGAVTDGPWTTTVTAPAFGLSRATLRRLAPPGGTVGLELVFTAPPDRSTLSAVRATLGGKPVKLSFEPGDGNVVGATFERGPEATEALLIEVDSGVRWEGDPKVVAAPFSAPVSLATGPTMAIEEVALREGGQGFYLEVVCNDAAAPGETQWRWLPDLGSWDLSSRCQLDEDHAARVIHTDPPVKLTFSPGLGGFRVFGDFPRGALELTIDAGTTTIDGGLLNDAVKRQFDVPERTPTLAFSGQGRYLPKKAWKNLEVRHLNVDRLDVEVRHVPADDLVFWMTGDEPTSRRTSNRIARTTLTVKNPPDEEATSFVSVASLVPDPEPGVYEINVDARGHTASARLLLTDLHLVAKADAPEPGRSWTSTIRVWALDVHTGLTKDDVQVRAVRASGQELASCETDGDRGCVLSLPEDPIDDSPPIALVARSGDDLTYIEFEDLRLDLPTDAGGQPYTTVVPFEAPLWTDRGVYRPGDTAHVAALVRDAAHVAPPADLPVLLRVFDPHEREARKRVVPTNAAGMLAADFGFGDYAATGKYRVVAEIGGQTVGETTFQVEEFVPERLAVKATAVGAGHLPEEEVDVEVSGQWLFGGSAVGSNVEVTCTVAPSTFTAPGYDGWSFGPAFLSTRPSPVTLATVHGELDTAGLSTVTCPAAGTAAQGATELVASASVFEGESGRTTVGEARTPIHPEKYWLGLDTSVQKAGRGQAVPMKGVVVDWSGKPVTGLKKVAVELLRVEEEYGWWWDEEEGSSRRRTLRTVKEQAFTVDVVDGKFAFDAVPADHAAGMVVRVEAGRTVTERFVEGTRAHWYWGDSESQVDATPRPARPTPLPLTVDGEVEVGAVTTVSTNAPYAGRILWTVETDEVLDAVWMQAAPGRNEWRFKVDAFAPNVYVSAFLVKDPHVESAEAFLPDRAFGVVSARVAPARFERALTLVAPEETKPYAPLEVELQLAGVAGPAFATVAAVDEGILSLTRFQTPDPLAVLFRRRALGVETFETVGWTRLVEAAGPSSPTGGDSGEGGAGARVQMVKPVALWSGLVALDADGKAKVRFDVPGYRGKLRVMAVAATADGVGRAEAAVVVRDPLVLLTTLPRFLLAGDTAQIPVQVTNTTRSAKDVVVKLEATELLRGAKPDATDGAPPVPVLSFTGPTEGTLRLEPGASETAVFEVKVRPMPGAAHFLVTATSGALRSKEELDLPIQVARSEVREVKTLLATGPTVDLKPAVAGFADGTDRSTVWVTANPYAESLNHLRYLVRYPFG